MASASELVRKRLSFSPSPSPSSASLTSRLSQEEIEEILTSPYETGYTYSSSAAYKRTVGSREFRHPQMCRRLRLAAPQFNTLTNQYDYYIFEDESSNKLNILEQMFYKLCHSIQVLIVFLITCLIFVWRSIWTAVKSTGSWLLKSFVLLPLSVLYYATVQGYRKAKYAYVASANIYPRVKQWFTCLYHKYISTTTTTTSTIVTEVDSENKDFVEQSMEPSYTHSTSKKVRPRTRQTDGSHKNYRNSLFKTIFLTIIWVLTMGLVGASNSEQREDLTSGTSLRTRSQIKGIFKKPQQQMHTCDGASFLQQSTENKISLTKIYTELFYLMLAPFKWLWQLISWLATNLRQLGGWLYTSLLWIYLGGVPKAIFTYCFTRSMDSSQVVSHKQTFRTRSMDGQEMVKENKESATILYIRENLSDWLRWLLIGLLLLFLLWFLLYPINLQSKEVPTHSALAALQHEIYMLKQDLKHLSLQQSESHHQHTHVHPPPVSSASDINGLDAKIAEILNQLMTSERQLILLKMKEVETRVLEKAKAEQSAIPQTVMLHPEAEQQQQAHLDEMEREVDKKIANFMSFINVQVNEQNSKLFSELEQLRESYIRLSTEKTTSKETKSTTLIMEKEKELDESLYLIKVRQMIKEYIQRYDADKTGLPDYALESSGGAVASIRCTVQYNERSRTQSIFGIPLWYSSYSPRSVIQRKGYGASAGECWAFVGPHGYLTVRLSQKINVTAVSYEHLPVQLSPDGHIQTAPKDFLIYSYQEVDDLDSRFLLGNYTYDDKGEPLQMFQIQNYDPRFTPVIELETTSNYGAMVTCLYRFRVHGALPNKTIIN